MDGGNSMYGGLIHQPPPQHLHGGQFHPQPAQSSTNNATGFGEGYNFYEDEPPEPECLNISEDDYMMGYDDPGMTVGHQSSYCLPQAAPMPSYIPQQHQQQPSAFHGHPPFQPNVFPPAMVNNNNNNNNNSNGFSMPEVTDVLGSFSSTSPHHLNERKRGRPRKEKPDDNEDQKIVAKRLYARTYRENMKTKYQNIENECNKYKLYCQIAETKLDTLTKIVNECGRCKELADQQFIENGKPIFDLFKQIQALQNLDNGGISLNPSPNSMY